MDIQNTEVKNLIPEVNGQQKVDFHQYCANWIWRAAECLVESPDFESSPKWTARRLNVSVEKVVDAFEGLERLGYIVRRENTFIKPKDYVSVDTSHLNSEDLLEYHSKLSPQITNKLTAKDKFSTWFFNADSNLIAEFTPKFMNLYKEMVEVGSLRKCKEIYASEISFAQLTIEEKDNRGIQ